MRKYLQMTKGFSMRIIFAFCLLWTFINADMIGYVVNVPRCDTISIEKDGKINNIRLMGIEILSNFNNKAKQTITDLCFEKKINIQEYHIDSLGRDVGVIICDGVEVNQMLVHKGFALTYRKDGRYADAMRKAQKAKRGMWERESLIQKYSYDFIQR